MYDGVWGLDNIEGVEGNAALLAERVEVLRALRKGLRDSKLIIKVNTNIGMSGTIGRDVLEEAGNRILRSHARRWGNLTPRAVYQPARPRNSEMFLRSVGRVYSRTPGTFGSRSWPPSSLGIDLGAERCVGSRDAVEEPLEEPSGFFSA